MWSITYSRHGNCPGSFRIHKTEDMRKVGFGGKQMESRNFVKAMEAYGKKTGLFARGDGMICTHWKLPNKGYPEGFTNYKTYGRYWWVREN